MTRTAIIVESRKSSKRLPGKNLKPILGRPMVCRLLERLKRCRTADVVCVATSTDPSDAPLEAAAREEGVRCYRGSLDDVLERSLQAAKSVGADTMVEITGDCPLADPGIIDAAVRRFARGDADYVCNVLDRLSFPIGFDVQVYKTKDLESIARLTQDPYDRVNVTPYFYRHPELYRLLNLLAPKALDRPRYRLCVDHPEDFEVVSALYEALYPQKPDFDARHIIAHMDAHPDLATRNTWREDSFTFPKSGAGSDTKAARQEVLDA